jgi:hypothetical protein
VSALTKFFNFMNKFGKFLFHTKIPHDLRMCHDLDPSSSVQVQGHWKKTFIIHFWYMYLLLKNLNLLLHTNIAFDLRLCLDFEPRSFMQVQGQ